MRLTHELTQRTEQRLLMLPKMLQSIEILQLPTADLRGLVEQALGENEMLACDGEAPVGEVGPTESAAVEGTLPEFDDPERAPRCRTGSREASDRKHRALESARAPSESLGDHLRAQIALAGLEPEFEMAVQYVVEHLDPATGWLPFDAQELARRAEGLFEAPDMEAAIACVQSLEPPGVGARDALACLRLQLDSLRARDRLVARILDGHLDDVAKNRLPKVARQLGVEIDAIQDALERLRGLETRPAARFLPDESPGIRPEVVVEELGDGYEVSLAEGTLPALRLSDEAEALTRERGLDRDVRGYLRERVTAARDLITAVEQRRRTLLLVSQVVFRRQRAFLTRGPAGLQPMRMQEIADELGLHVSTISRAIAGVHAQTPRGIVALRDLFCSATLDSGNLVARGSALDALRQVMAEEDPTNPFSDDDIRDRLRERHGFHLARRTVTKYRKELGIPSSWRRRAHG